ncbi:hypothetical protein JMJ77_0006393 [Colletotrichum scovillei]|uniref:Uncharacterized protein n=1 Tax=Colletotrichum scovillei TaxID=1209932 RepID=A0A9P7RJZ7_9PEZI|nr:hypothetical protein JMJ77_0006393 [Colletotrichum scovillei]KAG7077667.1 hypothetical protein JMJ76_0014912 [Colletotrichum scovillei]KAG7084717.1 hypothetical protein JMJ78_0010150 [Colletotrichum scovillei]
MGTEPTVEAEQTYFVIVGHDILPTVLSLSSALTDFQAY